jgi:hypothetical protein
MQQVQPEQDITDEEFCAQNFDVPNAVLERNAALVEELKGKLLLVRRGAQVQVAGPLESRNSQDSARGSAQVPGLACSPTVSHSSMSQPAQMYSMVWREPGSLGGVPRLLGQLTCSTSVSVHSVLLCQPPAPP